MFALPLYHPQPTAPATSTIKARLAYEQELERLACLTQQHEQQRRRAEAAAREAALAAYLEEQERRQREAAFERAVQHEVERRRRDHEAALVQEALEHRAALARRAQQERDAALYRQAVVEAAQRRAALVAREQHRRRLEAEQDQRRRVVEARRQQRQRQNELPQSLFQLFLDMATSAAHDHDEQPEQQAVAAPGPAVAAEAASSSSPSAPTAAVEPSLPDPAIEALQKRFERDAARQAALETLNRLSTEFDSRLSSFTSPSSLTFQSPPSTSTSTPSTPPLAYGKPNAAFLGHEDFLVALLSKVDAVTSGGDKVIQQARKDLVKRVELELAKLDQLKEHEWERQSERARSEAGEGSVHGQDDDAAAAGASSLPSLVVLLLRSRADVLPLAAPSSSADTAAAEPEPTVAQPAAPASSSSSPPTDGSTSAHAETPIDDSTRLTAESLAALSTAAAVPTSTVPRPRSRASTTSHASDTSSAVDRYVFEMLRRAKELAERVDAKEEAERAAFVSSPASGDELGAADEASATLPAAVEVERAATPAPSTASEPLEDGVDEEIDVEATLRLKRSSSAAAAAPAAAASLKEEEPLEREEQAVHEREAEEDAPSESGTEEFLVV